MRSGPARWRFWLLILTLALGGAGCTPGPASEIAAQPASATAAPTATVPPTQPPATPTAALAVVSPTAAAPPTASPTALPPTPTPCAPGLCVFTGRLALQRPILPPGVDTVDRSYAFGSTQEQKRDPHHGVEFLNPFGTPVQAAADGVVLVAEDDREYYTKTRYELTEYGPFPYFYGNVIVLEHTPPPGLEGPLYTLYAHLSEILVAPGQVVQAGQEIGRVGQTGAATGSHLHFEVRYGANNYGASRNPELWLLPRPDAGGQTGGALAVHTLDINGQPVAPESVVLERLSGPGGVREWQVYPQAYEEPALLGQAPYQDSFGIGDLPAGWYRLSFVWQGMHQREVEILPGALTLLTVQID